jgi:hypothetical protein
MLCCATSTRTSLWPRVEAVDDTRAIMLSTPYSLACVPALGTLLCTLSFLSCTAANSVAHGAFECVKFARAMCVEKVGTRPATGPPVRHPSSPDWETTESGLVPYDTVRCLCCEARLPSLSLARSIASNTRAVLPRCSPTLCRVHYILKDDGT